MKGVRQAGRASAIAAWVALPVVPGAVASAPLDGLGVAVEAALVVVLLPRLSPALRRGAAVGWALLLAWRLAQAASRGLADATLPLADLFLLVRPLVVVGADLYGPVVYGALGVALLAPLGLAWLGDRLLREVGPRPLPRWAPVVLALACLLPGSRVLLVGLGADVVHSAQMARAFRDEVARRDRDALAGRPLTRRADVQFLIVESYGMVTAELGAAPRWRRALDALGTATDAAGWHVVSGQGVAPVHGSRSWVADASVLTGLFIAHQADYERAVHRADRSTTLPSWWAAQGGSSLLVRPTDRARPGVHLTNHFGFGHTAFFDDMAYQGPAVGWGYVPDQYTLHRVQHELLPALPAPRLAFVHLASSHVPWDATPPLLPDPTGWNRRQGARDWQRPEDASPWRTLRLMARRFQPNHRQATDVGAIQGTYVDTVVYSLRAVVDTLPEPGPDGMLVVVMGDHQPPFLASERGPEVPVHVLASDPALLAPFVAAGFTPGWHPADASVAHHDLWPLVVDAVDPPQGASK